MRRRTLPLLVTSAVLLGAAPARADVAIAGYHIVPSEAVFTGVRDFPAYRFVVAVHSSRPPPDQLYSPIPPPAPAREGEIVSTDTRYFQELRAIPADAPDPVTDEWVLASKAPTSGSFKLHPYRAPDGSNEEKMRTRYHVRQVQGGWIALELLSAEVVMTDGSTRPLYKLVPRTWKLESVEAPPGWQLYVMPDPSWPRAEPPLPAVPVEAGDLLPLSPSPRTLVAVFGEVGPGGSLDGKRHLKWGYPLSPWEREELLPESGAVEYQSTLEVHIQPGTDDELGISRGERFRSPDGDWYADSELTFPDHTPMRWARRAAAGTAGAALLLTALWAWRRRRARKPAPPENP